MLGFSHAISGGLAWLAVAPALSAAVLKTPPEPVTLALGAAVTAGAAVLPDMDHPKATVAKTFGGFSTAVAEFTERVSGGHRNGTHSLLFALGAGLIVQLIAVIGWQPAIMAVVFILTAFAIKALNLSLPVKSRTVRSLSVIVFAGLVTFGAFSSSTITMWSWLGFAVFLGCIVHCIGDSLTPQRVPWLWPKRKRYGYPIISVTGNKTETMIITPIMGIALIFLTWVVILRPVIQT